MANVTTLLRSSLLNKIVEVAAFLWNGTFALTNGIAANGDRIQLFTVTRNMRVIHSILNVDATLGAGATLKLQRDRSGVYVDLTVATTAGAASIVTGITLGAIDLAEGDIVTALVGGANITAAANANVDLLVQSK